MRRPRVEETHYETNPELAAKQLRIFANELASAYSAAKQREKDLRELYMNFAFAFALTVEAQDPEIRVHLSRCRFWATELSKRMNLDGLHDLEIGYLVHDVGKWMIPQDLLVAPRPLTEPEWEIMKTHPAAGAQMLKDVVPPEAITVVRSHHERWDGTGYPERLSGEDIPIGARVFTVVDVFDAITNVRPYRASTLTFAEALDLIVKDRGSHFDPKVVDAFVAMMQELIEEGRATAY